MTIAALPRLRAFSRDDASTLSDDDLIDEQRAFAEARRLVDAGAAAVAAEIAARSRRELGSDGLAQSRGARTPEALVAQVTGLSSRDARTLVTVGTLVSAPEPWLVPVAEAVSDGTLTVDAADMLRSTLAASPGAAGSPDRIGTAALRAATQQLVSEADGLTLEQLAARARVVRAGLDVAGVAVREQELRDRRYLSLTKLPDGMTRVSGLLDPESAAIVSGAIDAATSPARGGPRFVDPAAAPQGVVEGDDRTVPQLLVDALVDVVVLATKADRGAVLGARRVGLRVHVAERDLRTGEGFAQIEGQTVPVSLTTAERVACDNGILPILFDTDGRVLNVGRNQRHHSPRMRTGMAARDGGCVINGCDRPPEWCEAHHIDEWLRHGGDTLLARTRGRSAGATTATQSHRGAPLPRRRIVDQRSCSRSALVADRRWRSRSAIRTS